jgi:hypothetical protein
MKGLFANAASPFIMLVLGVLFSLLLVLSLVLLENPSENVSVYDVVVPVSEEVVSVNRDSIRDERRTQGTIFGDGQSELPAYMVSLDQMVPLAASPNESTAVTIWQSRGSWSLGNGVLSLVGLMEALTVMSIFFIRSWKTPPNLFTKGFMLRMPVLVTALICLVVTGITSDFAQPVAIFNGVSLPIVTLFIAQQLMLPSMRTPKAPVENDEVSGRRFRAQKRYEG